MGMSTFLESSPMRFPYPIPLPVSWGWKRPPLIITTTSCRSRSSGRAESQASQLLSALTCTLRSDDWLRSPYKKHAHMTSHRSRKANVFVDNPSDPCVSLNKSPPKQSNSMTNDLWKNVTKHKYYLSGVKRQSRRDVLSRLFPTDYSRSA